MLEKINTMIQGILKLLIALYNNITKHILCALNCMYMYVKLICIPYFQRYGVPVLLMHKAFSNHQSWRQTFYNIKQIKG